MKNLLRAIAGFLGNGCPCCGCDGPCCKAGSCRCGCC